MRPATWALAAAALAAAAVTGCASSPAPPNLAGAGPITRLSTLPAPSPSAAPARQAAVQIGALDTLDVNVFGVESLTRTVQVDADGRIAYPMIGPIPVAGDTPQQAAEEITRRLSAKYMQDPQVTVSIKTSISQRVTVEGAVNQSGVYPITGHTTLLQVIALAHGTDPYANTKQVAIFRSISGQRMVALFNLNFIESGKMAEPEIYADDTVVVASDANKKLFATIVQASPLLAIFGHFY